MLYREIIAVCSQIHTKHINTLCGQNVELLDIKLEVTEMTRNFGRSVSYTDFVQYLSCVHYTGCSWENYDVKVV